VADSEQAAEKSSSLVVIGWMFLLFDALLVFFLPAAVRRGHPAGFEIAVAVLGVLGVVLLITGFRGRRKSR